MEEKQGGGVLEQNPTFPLNLNLRGGGDAIHSHKFEMRDGSCCVLAAEYRALLADYRALLSEYENRLNR